MTIYHPATLTTRQWSTLLSRCERAGRGELADAIRAGLGMAAVFQAPEFHLRRSIRDWSILLGLARQRPRSEALVTRLEAVLGEAMDATRVTDPVAGEAHIELVASERT